ncbi:MAG: hypothetical protein KHX34_04570, partial [Clostridiales bacterium]|nr:hypothetical protein [Clostridiales bacterium]
RFSQWLEFVSTFWLKRPKPGILSSPRGKSRPVSAEQTCLICADGPIKAQTVSEQTTGGIFRKTGADPRRGCPPRPRPLLLSVAFSHPAAGRPCQKKITSAKLFAEVISWS